MIEREQLSDAPAHRRTDNVRAMQALDDHKVNDVVGHVGERVRSIGDPNVTTGVALVQEEKRVRIKGVRDRRRPIASVAQRAVQKQDGRRTQRPANGVVPQGSAHLGGDQFFFQALRNGYY